MKSSNVITKRSWGDYQDVFAISPNATTQNLRQRFSLSATFTQTIGDCWTHLDKRSMEL